MTLLALNNNHTLTCTQPQHYTNGNYKSRLKTTNVDPRLTKTKRCVNQVNRIQTDNLISKSISGNRHPVNKT